MSTYDPIASITLANTSTTNVDFIGIPQTYTDLVLVIVANSNSASGNYVYVQFNGDTGSNYSTTILGTNGTTLSPTRFSNRTNFNIDFYSTPQTTGFSTRIVEVANYSNPNVYKTGLVRAVRGTGGSDIMTGNWRSVSAITSMKITIDQNTFASGTTFNLYGIANAGITNVAKATGGDSVYTDGTYWYHTFLSSGTFTPTQALTADYLVVAGGGSGGLTNAGGGGAGGMRSTVSGTGGSGSLESPLSLTAQAYTVTIGAGGAVPTSAGNRGNNGSNSVFSTITSTGGGGGGSYGSGQRDGNAGGSGGGGGYYDGNPANTPVAGTGGAASPSGQGFAGGNAVEGAGTQFTGAGGGGAAAVGANASTTGNGATTAGGAGRANSISGTSVTYALGGNGAYGGTPGNTPVQPAGVANTGGGGGAGASGGSGIVIVRYAV